jgi:hypothetical protein
MLIHAVYFWLEPELNGAQRAEFRRGVESLTAITHVEKVHLGAPAAVPDRPVADKTFDVGLVVVCRDVAAYNAYQMDPIHQAFAARFKSYWTRVQIYDFE